MRDPHPPQKRVSSASDCACARDCPGNGRRSFGAIARQPKLVLPGLAPGIHAVAAAAGVARRRVDGRIKSGHDCSKVKPNGTMGRELRIVIFPGQACPYAGVTAGYNIPSSSFASSFMRSGVQGGGHTRLTHTSSPPSTPRIVASTCLAVANKAPKRTLNKLIRFPSTPEFIHEKRVRSAQPEAQTRINEAGHGGSGKAQNL